MRRREGPLSRLRQAVIKADGDRILAVFALVHPGTVVSPPCVWMPHLQIVGNHSNCYSEFLVKITGRNRKRLAQRQRPLLFPYFLVSIFIEYLRVSPALVFK